MANKDSLVEYSLATHQAFIDDDRKTWDRLDGEILARQGRIITLRGAGSVNGMDRSEIDSLLRSGLTPRIRQSVSVGEPVTIMYDGDPDSLDKPDIGYVAGRLLDTFNNNGVLFLAAQKRSWYYPPIPNGNLRNANDRDYVTYVFEDNKYHGDHNSFTQDARLVAATGFEEWFIGASGDIATDQLHDFNSKVPNGQIRKALVFRVHNNPALDIDIGSKIAEAERSNDIAKLSKFIGQLHQRKNIYGAHWNNDGTPRIKPSEFRNLALEFIK